MKNLLILLTISGIFGYTEPVSNENHKSPIEGVWIRHIDQYHGPDTTAYARINVPPDVMIFTPKYYSDTGNGSGEKRPLITDDMSELEKLRIRTKYHANSGTYTLTDSTVTFHPITNMNPNKMLENSSLTYRIKLEPDTLTFFLKNWTFENIRLE